ncbi:MAG: NAD(+) synthase, partial [Candidatus Thermoplasmatota archaeon]
KSIGNLKARIRMLLLYAYANSKNLIVVGTGNKTELLCGYFTKFGDGGADILPIGDLYKTQVREMARFLEIPEKIINKVPSAGLWKGQTDEDELGIKYEKLDKILYGIELGLDKNEISNKVELPIKEVERIMNMVELTKHKRKFPLIPKIGYCTVGFDWRE